MGKSRLWITVVIGLLALAMRGRAMWMLPVDYDEPVYLEAATQYATALEGRDWPALLQNRHSIEHPALVKLLYAISISVGGAGRAALQTARALSVLFGVLQVMLLALLNPLAGLFLAIHTMTIKYTSQAYLEALPAFASLLAIVGYEKSVRAESAINRWLVVSALALGCTAAAKYTYLVVALVILPLLIGRNLRRPWVVTLYGGVALLTFFLLDLQIWVDPLGRLWQSLSFHTAYAQSSYVQSMGLPWYQQLYYLSRAVPWHPGVFPLSWDRGTFALGVLGVPILYRRRPIYAQWLLVGMAALLLWPTRWPQYTLLVVAPLCLSGALLIEAGLEWVDRHSGVLRALRPFLPDRGTTLFLVSIALGLLALATYVQVQFVEEMKGWTYWTTLNSNLPSNTIRALALDSEGRIWAGTEAGPARFDGSHWTTYNTGLPDSVIRAMAVDHEGRLWVGTDNGLGVLDGETWHRYTTADSGLIDDRILCIAPLPAALDTNPGPGPIWFGTASGASYFDGQKWTRYSADNSGLAGSRVMSIAVDAQGRVWFGTWGGLSVLDGQSWTSYTTANSGLGFDTVSAVVIDREGRIWCGTLDGISVFDGARWRSYSMMNMALRFNTATVLTVDRRGQVWVGGDLPTGPIGAAAMFDGEQWHDYSRHFAGGRQAPVRAIVADAENRIWFGTLLEGIAVYEGPE